MKIILTWTLTIILSLSVFAQAETLTNKDIILMTQAGLSKDLIIRKIKASETAFDTSTNSLIALKKEGVSDDAITLMMDAKLKTPENLSQKPVTLDTFYKSSKPASDSIIALSTREAIRKAKTIATKKSSLHPSRQSLEKELFKRPEWEGLNLTLVRYKNDADLLIEIGYVSMSWITHRYVYRIYDNKSVTVIAAGETTSWGSLSKNLARGITKKLKKEMDKSN